jgi:hypothetical protein
MFAVESLVGESEGEYDRNGTERQRIVPFAEYKCVTVYVSLGSRRAKFLIYA